MNTQKILVENGLDFNISKRPLDNDGIFSGYYGLYNDKLNKCIKTVKKDYHVSQNEEVIDLMLKGIEKFEGELKVSKGGSINEGRKVYLQLELNGYSKVANDEIKRYITLLDSNDGTTSLSIGIGDLTMSCENQFYKFYKEGSSKFRHSSTLSKKMQEIPFLIEGALNRSMKQIELYERLAEIDLTAFQIDAMVNNLLGFDDHFTSKADLVEKSTRSLNKMEALYAAIDIEIDDKGKNLWGLHSGVTRFTTHNLSAPKRENGKIESLIQGGAYKLNQKSLEYVTRKSGILELV